MRAVAVFLVNHRDPLDADLKDAAFAFQATLIVESTVPCVPRPNPRGRDGDEADQRISDLQYRDAVDYAVGHAGPPT